MKYSDLVLSIICGMPLLEKEASVLLEDQFLKMVKDIMRLFKYKSGLTKKII